MPKLVKILKGGDVKGKAKGQEEGTEAAMNVMQYGEKLPDGDGRGILKAGMKQGCKEGRGCT